MATPWKSEEERKECLEKQKIQIPLTKRYKCAGDLLSELILRKEWELEEAIEFLYSIKDADVGEIKYRAAQHFAKELKSRCVKRGIYPAFVEAMANEILKEIEEGKFNV